MKGAPIMTNNLYLILLAEAEYVVRDILSSESSRLMFERSSERSRKLDSICVRANEATRS